MRCVVCDKNEWQNVDEYRELAKHKGKPVGMSLCKSCGFISYPNKYKTEDEIKEYYRTEYRGGAPNFGNLSTGSRKLHYHGKFLKDLFKSWQDDGNTAPVIGEIGSAYGMVLDWLRKIFPEADLNGVELTRSYVNAAFHEYGLELKEDLDLTKQYDLIISYKVAEHQIDVDKRIREYALALKPKGKLYISVPTWFNALHNPGTGGFDLEYYYHPDHINVWTRIHFEEVLRKSGFKIEKIDRLVYGDTYLCVRDDSVMSEKSEYENPEEILKVLERIKKAHAFMKANKAKEALEMWGNFPMAWFSYYEQNRKELHDKYSGDGKAIAEALIGEMTAACGDILETKYLKGDILNRYNHYAEAIEAFNSIVEIKPNDTPALFAMSNCFRTLSQIEKDPLKKTRLLLTARDICRNIMRVDESRKPDAYNWIMRDEAIIDIDLAKQALDQGRVNGQI